MPLVTALACTRFSRVALAAVAALLCRPAFLGAQRPPAQGPVTVVETSLADLRTALEQKRITSREIVQQSLAIAGELCIYTNMNHTIEVLE